MRIWRKWQIASKIKVIPQAEGNEVIWERALSNLILTAVKLDKRNSQYDGLFTLQTQLDTKQKIHLEAEELVYVVAGPGS